MTAILLILLLELSCEWIEPEDVKIPAFYKWYEEPKLGKWSEEVK